MINPALSHLTKHLGIGQLQKAFYFSAFFWSPHRSLVSIGQHFVTTRVVHLLIRTEASLITDLDQIGPNQRIEPGCAGRALLQQLIFVKFCRCKSCHLLFLNIQG